MIIELIHLKYLGYCVENGLKEVGERARRIPRRTLQNSKPGIMVASTKKDLLESGGNSTSFTGLEDKTK